MWKIGVAGPARSAWWRQHFGGFSLSLLARGVKASLEERREGEREQNKVGGCGWYLEDQGSPLKGAVESYSALQ